MHIVYDLLCLSLLSGSGGGHIAIHDRSLLSGRKTFSTVAEISR